MSDDKPEVDEAKTEADEAKANVASDPQGSVQTTETQPTKSEAADLKMSAERKPDEPTKNAGQKPSDGHGHPDGHGHGHGHDDHGLAHTMPLPLLFGVLGALLALTVATVAVTAIDLGAQGNLIVAMIIATVKAALVCVFFMHLLWDKKFNALLFLTSVLLLILFLSLTVNDRGEYQHDVDAYRALQLQAK
ncbi:MAG TPA: cytochrome C oxidase subunit IV family protein [Polyangiaceae bacterium]|nr:cytochrome C oxidase subunit IV family protein [Polyangiaceae bacterium]